MEEGQLRSYAYIFYGYKDKTKSCIKWGDLKYFAHLFLASKVDVPSLDNFFFFLFAPKVEIP